MSCSLSITDTLDLILVKCEVETLELRKLVQSFGFILLTGVAENESVFQNRSARESIFVAVSLWFAKRSSAVLAYGKMDHWDTSRVTNMQELFMSREVVDADISSWDIRSVRNMDQMLAGPRPPSNWSSDQVMRLLASWRNQLEGRVPSRSFSAACVFHLNDSICSIIKKEWNDFRIDRCVCRGSQTTSAFLVTIRECGTTQSENLHS